MSVPVIKWTIILWFRRKTDVKLPFDKIHGYFEMTGGQDSYN